MTRRKVFQTAAAVPLAARGATSGGPSIYERKLGIKPVINGVGTVTVLGGCIMPPEVIRAMDEAAHHFVPLPELQKKAGERIAELLKAPAAMVTGGAAASITVAAVACMARGDQKKLRQLPETDGMPFEVIQQKTHRSGYEHQMTLAGAKIVTVETREQLDNAITARTAMLFFLNKADPDGLIRRAEWIEVGRKRGVPVFNDAAADVPGKEKLWKYVHEGFDLVAFSGGKGLLGPQSSGLLLGRKDLIEAATEAQSPHGGIGRGMKVGKEEIMGLLAAVERYLKVDHDAEFRELDRRVNEMIGLLAKVDGVRASRFVPEIANQVPHLRVEWTEGGAKPAAQRVQQRLLEGDPPIHIQRRGEGQLVVSVWMMRGTEHRVVARRLVEALREV